MRKTDIRLFDELGAADESRRLAAAWQLSQLPRDHFNRETIGKFRLTPEQACNLRAAWQTTANDAVKLWATLVLAKTYNNAPEDLATYVETLKLDGPGISEIMDYLWICREQLPNKDELFRTLSRHPHPQVRWRAVNELRSMAYHGRFDLVAERPLFHALLRDPNASVSCQALLIADDKPERLDFDDYEVLLDVINMHSSSPRSYAVKLKEKLEQTVPGCTPTAFAPREPLLRSDGLYYRDFAQLDDDGRWLHWACLRFHEGAAVEFFGTDVPPVDFRLFFPGREPAITRHPITRHDDQIRFRLAHSGKEFDCTGIIDGDKLRLTSVDRKTGETIEQDYQWTYVDWDGAPFITPSAPPVQTPSRNRKPSPPFIPCKPRSMTASDATKWYLQMLARLPLIVATELDEIARVPVAWQIRSQMRDAAANALFDSDLKAAFLKKLPLPALEEFTELPAARALGNLYRVTEAEARAFPGTIGESIGLTYWDGQQRWVMTESGWVAEGA